MRIWTKPARKTNVTRFWRLQLLVVKITFVQVAGLVARRILCYTQAGAKLSRGERYGFIRFGSRVDMYLPVDAQAQVAIGDKVTGVSTVLARLPLTTPETRI